MESPTLKDFLESDEIRITTDALALADPKQIRGLIIVNGDEGEVRVFAVSDYSGPVITAQRIQGCYGVILDDPGLSPRAELDGIDKMLAEPELKNFLSRTDKIWALKRRLRTLEEAITHAVTEKLDDICWIDVYRDLAKLVGIDFKPEMLGEEEMLANCGRFVRSMLTGTEYDGYNPSADTAIRVAFNAVLNKEDAVGLTQRHVDDIKTLIEAYLWSEEADLIVQKAAKEIRDEHLPKYVDI